MWEFMIQVAVSEKRNYITSYLSFQQIYFIFPDLLLKCDESITALKILTENKQRTTCQNREVESVPNFPNCDQISPPLLRVTIRRNCIKRSRVLEGTENNEIRGGKRQHHYYYYIPKKCLLGLCLECETFIRGVFCPNLCVCLFGKGRFLRLDYTTK